jgi:hypothetical protein
VLRERADLLFAWSAHARAIEYENAQRRGADTCLRDSLRHTLDAYAAFAIDLAPLLPACLALACGQHEK